jgi:hypothetical protein
VPKVGDLVKPAKRDGTWRLGVVERVTDDGRLAIRLYVAPAGAYAGVIQHSCPKDVAVVTRDQANGVLVTTRAEILSRQQLVRQLEEALAAADDAVICISENRDAGPADVAA